MPKANRRSKNTAAVKLYINTCEKNVSSKITARSSISRTGFAFKIYLPLYIVIISICMQIEKRYKCCREK